MYSGHGVQAGSTSTGNMPSRALQGESGPQEKSVLEREVEQAQRFAGDLHGVIERLEKRLQPIAVPSQPDRAETNSAVPTAPTALSGVLQELNRANGHAVLRLQVLLDRIDL